MDFHIRKIVTIIEENKSEYGLVADRPLRKVAVAAVIENPYAGAYHEDLSEAVQWSSELGGLLGERAVKALGESVESYGKGGIVGLNGEMDHAQMF